jgi:hypothetical protein
LIKGFFIGGKSEWLCWPCRLSMTSEEFWWGDFLEWGKTARPTNVMAVKRGVGAMEFEINSSGKLKLRLNRKDMTANSRDG